jgi:coenzyme F420-dependent glucose-6-phosphate dehydrogenase
MNEVSAGFDWPSADIRLKRITEAIQIIKQLWNKKEKKNQAKYDTLDNRKESNDEGFVNFNGEYFKIRNAKLYTPPSTNIPLYMAASGSEATKIAAKYSDGLITISKPDKVKEMFDIFDKAILEENKEPNSVQKIGKPKVSYSEDYDRAFRASDFWRAGDIEDVFNTDINDPRALQQKAKQEVSDDKLKESTLIVTSIEDFIKPIEQYFQAGFTQIYVHSTSPNELEFVPKFCTKVLPYFKDSK